MTDQLMDLIQEINKRNIRIETKLTRMVNGEDDKGVTIIEYELDFVDNAWCLRVMSGNISIKQIASIMSQEGVESGEMVGVYANGKYALSVMA